MGYNSVKVNDDVKALLDDDKGDGETRNEQMKRLLNGNETPPHPESIERRLAAIEAEIRAVKDQGESGYVERVKTLENRLSAIETELQQIRESMERQR